MNLFSKNIITKVMILSLFMFICVGVNNSYAQGIPNPAPDGGLAQNSTDAAYEALKKKAAEEEAAKQKAKEDKKAAKDKAKADKKDIKNKTNDLENKAEAAQDKANQMSKNYEHAEKQKDKAAKDAKNATDDYNKARAEFDAAVKSGDLRKADRMKAKMEKAQEKMDEAKADFESSQAAMERNSPDKQAEAQKAADAEQAKLDQWNSLSPEQQLSNIESERLADMAEADLEAELAQEEVDAQAAQAAAAVVAQNAKINAMLAESEEEDLDIDDELEIVDTVVIEGENITGIFSKISAKAADAITNISHLAYILAGFGMIAFTFAAIFGKMNWKHFGNIAIGLMMVASSGMIIEFFVTPPGTPEENYRYKLSFGDYISSAVGDSLGQPGLNKEDPIDLSGLEEKTKDNGLMPMNSAKNGTGIPKAEKKKSLWGKIKDAGNFVNDTAKTVKKGVQTASKLKSNAKDVANLAGAMGEAIKSGNFDEIGDNASAMLGVFNDSVGATTDVVNETTGLAIEANNYSNTGNYDKNKYKDHEGAETNRISNEISDALTNTRSTVDDVDDFADQADDTIDTANSYGNYLN